MAKETSLRNDLRRPAGFRGDGLEFGVVRVAVARKQRGGERRDGLQRRAKLVGHVGDQLAGGGQLLTAEQLLPHGVLFLQLERGGDLVGQVLHGRLLALAEIMEAAGVMNLQHAHQLALREHRNQQYRARRQHRVFLAGNAGCGGRLEWQAAHGCGSTPQWPEAMEPEGASGSMDSTAVLLECTPSSVLVARLWM